ncbi:MAG: rhomboid family intramembrane serine protease [Gordonia sp.]|nr:rhomboid family intramembrane serine protease [Gordonia sp. (in: high G+C Gram-positive bacteria)]
MTGSLGSYGGGLPSGGPPVPARTSWPLWARSALVIAVLTALLYVIEAIDAVSRHDLDSAGIEPREADGLTGIFFSPFLHADWEHLAANTLPGMVLGFLVLMARRFIVTTAIVWVVSGLGVWLFAPPYTVTVGASGIIFGWLTYILVRGLFNRDVWQVLLGVVVFMVYGGVLWGVVPTDGRVSWQGHLFGAIGGVLAAWYLSKKDRKRDEKKALTQ